MVSTNEVKEMIISVLNLEDISPSDIADDSALFKDGLGLDSVDAIELMVMLDNKFKIKLENADAAKSMFASVKTLTDFINQHEK
jgi:acyl carrier protein